MMGEGERRGGGEGEGEGGGEGERGRGGEEDTVRSYTVSIKLDSGCLDYTRIRGQTETAGGLARLARRSHPRSLRHILVVWPCQRRMTWRHPCVEQRIELRRLV